MKTEDLMKYLGCTVLGLVLIYLTGVVLKINNDFVGSVLGGNFMQDQGYRLGSFENRYRLNGGLKHYSEKINGSIHQSWSEDLISS